MPAFDFVLGGRYRLVAPLGEGGMASVYRARDLRLNREVAVKILREDLTRDPGFLTRFEREAQVVAGLAHPNIVPVYDVGEEGGAPYIIMEYVRGRTLKEMLESTGPVSEERAVAIMLPVLDALGYAHLRGLIHRDVKPHNILLTPEGTPRLADFGIVHLVDSPTTRTAAILGSAQYLSPEQSLGEEATERSDLYACGVVLYEMLTGKPPFEGPNALAVATQHVRAPVPPLAARGAAVSPELEKTIGRALEKDPNARFADAAELQSALRHTESGAEATAIQPLDATTVMPIRGGEPDTPQAEDTLVAQPPIERTAVSRMPDLVLRRSMRKTVLLGVLLALLILVLAYAARLSVSGYALPSYPSTPYMLLPAVCMAALVLSWLSTRSWRYTMDRDAAVVQWGLLSHHRLGVPIRTITTLELKQSPFERLIGVGTVELLARDQHGTERRIVMEDLPHPRQTYEELMRHVGRAIREYGGAQ